MCVPPPLPPHTTPSHTHIPHPAAAAWCQVGKLLGEEWKALSAEDKVQYEAQAAKDKERYAAGEALLELGAHTVLFGGYVDIACLGDVSFCCALFVSQFAAAVELREWCDVSSDAKLHLVRTFSNVLFFVSDCRCCVAAMADYKASGAAAAAAAAADGAEDGAGAGGDEEEEEAAE